MEDSSRYARHSTRTTLRLLLISGLALSLIGCASSPSNVSHTQAPQTTSATTYHDNDWAETLRICVRDGLIDYQRLAKKRDSLDRYAAILAHFGPTATPDQFPTPQAKSAYWLNAYNALTLVAVLEKYPVESMYELNQPRLEHQYHFQIDNREMNLHAIEAELLKASQHDIRVLLATSRASVSTPRLLSRPYRAGNLDRQLAQAAASALSNSDVMRIDHVSQSILVWQEIIRRENAFLAYYKRVRRTPTAYLFNVLSELASPDTRRAIQSAVGYNIREIPFDRRLNDTAILNKENPTTEKRTLIP